MGCRGQTRRQFHGFLSSINVHRVKITMQCAYSNNFDEQNATLLQAEKIKGGGVKEREIESLNYGSRHRSNSR